MRRVSTMMVALLLLCALSACGGEVIISDVENNVAYIDNIIYTGYNTDTAENATHTAEIRGLDKSIVVNNSDLYDICKEARDNRTEYIEDIII